MAKRTKVWEVLADGAGDGPAGDGTHISRFRERKAAETFAETATCYGKKGCLVTETEASPAQMKRWTFRG